MNKDIIECHKIKFSVAMCVYIKDNHLRFKKALESIFNQTSMPDEVVLVVDGPVNSNINDVIALYDKKRNIKVIRLKKNVGHGRARQISIENTSHELVALMDADDISVKKRFETQINCFVKNPNLDIVGSNIIEFIDTVDNTVGIRKVPKSDKDIKKFLKKRCPMNQVTVMFKKSTIQKAGGYISWYQEEDYYLWVRLYEQGAKFKNIQENLVYVRVGEDMYRRRGGIKYFRSERKLQKYMLNNGIISYKRYYINVFLRLILQVILPNSVRGYVFKKIARQH